MSFDLPVRGVIPIISQSSASSFWMFKTACLRSLLSVKMTVFLVWCSRYSRLMKWIRKRAEKEMVKLIEKKVPKKRRGMLSLI